MSLVVEPIETSQTLAWRLDPAQPDAATEAFIAAARLGYAAASTTFPQPNSTIVMWTVKLTKPGSPDILAAVGDWLVCHGQHVGAFTNSEFISTFTVDVPLVWDGLAPVVEALPSDQYTVSFAEPTSPCGPFTYTVHDGDAALDVIETSVTDGVVTLRGDGLITGQEYTFTVTVGTRYGGSETSAPSNTVTAIL
jgi:hypothetical protein